ncbi:hypothetical protein BT67DRAFT_438800 [Trichocladium antarcticum]|uniref:Uncharacterized protein n=1 Tax=Trichocladium antarcticum TaxID=1450529 RepID=A0AAN6ZHA7_9PEZI|nr:hypothetical protein BT67DRAFT_438800 [Trichocladium antarcticum]
MAAAAAAADATGGCWRAKHTNDHVSLYKDARQRRRVRGRRGREVGLHSRSDSHGGLSGLGREGRDRCCVENGTEWYRMEGAVYYSGILAFDSLVGAAWGSIGLRGLTYGVAGVMEGRSEGMPWISGVYRLACDVCSSLLPPAFRGVLASMYLSST